MISRPIFSTSTTSMMTMSSLSLSLLPNSLNFLMESDDFTIKRFTNGMTIDLNVFGALMEYWISCNLHSTSIISMKVKLRKLKLSQQTPKSNNLRTGRIHGANLDSVEDLDTRSCFLLFQKTGTLPINIHQSVIERRVSRQPVQSAPLYATN